MAQIIETPLLNRLNYPTLIASKASRVKEAARGGTVIEFGLRRGPAAGADAGTRAALIGGCDFSSNVAVSHAMGIDPKGTHAHSMIQAFVALGRGELEAFRSYASVYPDETILLVDTVDVLGSGVPNAIRVFEEMRAAGLSREKAERQLGWVPEVDLEEGLKRLMAWRAADNQRRA